MPNRILKQAIKESYASPEASEIIYHTIELSHSLFVAPFRFVQGYDDISVTLEDGTSADFKAFPFEIMLPDIVENPNAQILLQAQNVNRDLGEALDLIVASQQFLRITYRPYLSSDLTIPQYDPPLRMVLRRVSLNDTVIDAQFGYETFPNLRFPNQVYKIEDFPTLEND